MDSKDIFNEDKLTVPATGKRVGGVCIALAMYFKTDATLLRITWAVVSSIGIFIGIAAFSIFPKGFGLLLAFFLFWIVGVGSLFCYLVGWVLIPKRRHPTTLSSSELVEHLLRRAEIHARNEADEFLKSKSEKHDEHLFFETFALELAAIWRASEGHITEPKRSVFAFEYDKHVKRLPSWDELDLRATLYSAALALDSQDNDLFTLSRVFAKFYRDEGIAIEYLVQKFKDEQFDPSLLHFGKRTFLRTIEWADDFIHSVKITT